MKKPRTAMGRGLDSCGCGLRLSASALVFGGSEAVRRHRLDWTFRCRLPLSIVDKRKLADQGERGLACVEGGLKMRTAGTGQIIGPSGQAAPDGGCSGAAVPLWTWMKESLPIRAVGIGFQQ